jgi:hypothetical protein
MKPNNPALHLEFEVEDAALTSLFIASFFERYDDDPTVAALEFHENITAIVKRKMEKIQ